MDFPTAYRRALSRPTTPCAVYCPAAFQNTPLVEAMQYGALLGGKRLRPFLVYATGNMFGVSHAGRPGRRR
jgi:farnesyl diphosphate synthase